VARPAPPHAQPQSPARSPAPETQVDLDPNEPAEHITASSVVHLRRSKHNPEGCCTTADNKVHR